MTNTPATGAFALKLGDKLLRDVTARIATAATSPGMDEMHDLRVSIRRFTQILEVLKPCFPRAESRRIRQALKRIMLLAGDVRNIDIALALIDKMAIPDSGPLVPQLLERREEAARALISSLHRWTERKLPESWRRARHSGNRHAPHELFSAIPVNVAAARILSRMVTEHFRRGKEAVRHKASVRDIHRFRIEVKALRYTLDFFAPLYGKSLAGLSARLKDMQTLLGDINDSASARRIVSAGAGESGRREIVSALKKRQRKKIGEFQERFAEAFRSTGTLRQWKDDVRRGGIKAAR